MDQETEVARQGEIALRSIAMLRAVVDGATYEAVALQFGISRLHRPSSGKVPPAFPPAARSAPASKCSRARRPSSPGRMQSTTRGSPRTSLSADRARDRRGLARSEDAAVAAQCSVVRGADTGLSESGDRRADLEAHGEDRGEGRRLYRFPVVFPTDRWQTVMPHEQGRAYVTYAMALIDAPDWLMSVYREGRCRGLRELYELRRLHDAEPEVVQEWLNGAGTVTRTDLRTLKERLQVGV